MSANPIHQDPVTPEDAAALLARGDICAIPTETVYGLAADAANSDAVLAVYEAKGRPRFNPLIAHCTDLAMAETLAAFSPVARALARAFWPGPLTLVLPRLKGTAISPLVTAGLDTIALRVPDHPLARSVIAALGRPLAAPSANPSGRLSPTSADQVRRGFGGTVAVLDGGLSQAGVESTILAVTGEQVIQLRAGALSRQDVADFLGCEVAVATTDAPVNAPGMLKSHYAPRATLRLEADRPEPGEAYLAFGTAPRHDGPLFNLSLARDLREAARNLFAGLDALDRSGAAVIAVAHIPDEGLGEAINDRLARAAAPREAPADAAAPA